MRHATRFILLASLFSAAAAQAPVAQKLPLRRIVLYKSGVGYFEHQGAVAGNQQIEIDLTSNQLNDVLQSLTALDLGGGRITGATYSSGDTVARQLEGLPFPTTSDSLLRTLAGLRGTELEVGAGTAPFRGRLLAAEMVDRFSASGPSSQVPEITLVNAAGEVRSFDLGPGSRLRFADPQLQQELGRALSLMDASRSQQTRRLLLAADGAGSRQIQVSYISEVPIWKTTYRIVLDASGQARLQGWGIVDNTVGEDWTNVQLALAAGAPQSFIQQLSQPYYARRPVVPLPQQYQTAPQTHAATLAEGNGLGAIAGQVSDESGAAIGGAIVRLFDSAGRQVATTAVNANGGYRFDNLSPGRYRVEVAHVGFQNLNATLQVQPGQTLNGSQRLIVAAAAQTVAIQAATSTLNESMRSVAAPPPFAGDAVAFAAPQGFQAPSAAQGEVVGELYQYQIRDPVTIAKNQSAMVPILDANLKAERVSLWHPGQPRPLRALWLTNSSGEVLDGGSFEIVDGNAFGGEGVLDEVQPGERRLVSYATDVGLQVATASDPQPEVTTRIKIVRGTMTRSTEVRRQTVYTVRNADDAARTLIIEQPTQNGWKLGPDPKPEEITASAARYRVQVPAHQSAALTLSESLPTSRQYSLSNLTGPMLQLWITNREIPAELEASLRQIVDAQAALAQASSAVDAAQQQRDAMASDQSRVRDNLKALPSTPEAKELTARYVAELNQQENQLQALAASMTDLQKKQQQAQQRVDDLIANLAFDSDPRP